ncbi:MAG: tripartite tricarboxylate transporter substrate binding protein [Betaproteobacteria bacterium]|nr:tripartite tricarboxylate transporter substrate binding protein [Betaproteobacteria bacterium]
MPRARPVALVAALACALLSAAPAAAQPYPAKPVRFIVPQAPGGATDVFARAVAQKLGERWGQTPVVENRAGAAGVIGTDIVAKAPADGYTLLVTYAGSQAVNQSLYAKLPFDSVKDFQPVATLAVTPFMLIVGPKLPVSDLKSFVAAARAKPGEINYASSGNGSVNHLLGEMLKTEAGINIVHVPYKGVAAAITDVIGGQVAAAWSSVPSVIELVKSGKVKALAVSSARRNAAAPDIPSVAESGFPGFDVNPWWGILAPAGTPRAIVDKLNAEIGGLLKTTAIAELFAKRGAEVYLTTPEQFQKLLEDDVQKWAKVVKASGARID